MKQRRPGRVKRDLKSADSQNKQSDSKLNFLFSHRENEKKPMHGVCVCCAVIQAPNSASSAKGVTVLDDNLKVVQNAECIDIPPSSFDCKCGREFIGKLTT